MTSKNRKVFSFFSNIGVGGYASLVSGGGGMLILPSPWMPGEWKKPLPEKTRFFNGFLYRQHGGGGVGVGGGGWGGGLGGWWFSAAPSQ